MDESDVERAVMTESMLLSARLMGIQRMVSRPAGAGGVECEDCGDRIPPERLRALPHARRCVDCQSREEGGRWR